MWGLRVLVMHRERRSLLGKHRIGWEGSIEMVFEEQAGRLCTGLIWLRSWTRGGLF